MNGAPYREGPTLEELRAAKAERERAAQELARVEQLARFAEAARACGVTPVSLARALANLFRDPRR